MRVCAGIDVAAPAADVWAFVTDPARTLSYMSGITRWEVVSDEPTGLGARYQMLMRVGSAEVGSLVEVVEFDEGRDMAWTSVTGVDQRGRWRLRERPTRPGQPARTHVELRLNYGVAGAGIFGWLSEQVAAPQVRRHLRRTVAQLKRQVEHERLRADAAARREARASV
jgi:uncharacterized membrane protein